MSIGRPTSVMTLSGARVPLGRHRLGRIAKGVVRRSVDEKIFVLYAEREFGLGGPAGQGRVGNCPRVCAGSARSSCASPRRALSMTASKQPISRDRRCVNTAGSSPSKVTCCLPPQLTSTGETGTRPRREGTTSSTGLRAGGAQPLLHAPGSTPPSLNGCGAGCCRLRPTQCRSTCRRRAAAASAHPSSSAACFGYGSNW
jgi:hypothetical protein